MKKLYLLALLFIFQIGKVTGQKNNDIFMANYGISFGVIPVQITGTTDVAGSYANPVYKRTDTTGIGMNFCMLIGGNFPLIRKETWSMGVKLHAAAGRQGNIKATEGLEAYILDFPEYVYYRNHGSSFDFSILAGVKHTRAALDYTLPMAGFDINFGDNSLRFYSSVKRYTYYSYYTNGDVKPFIKIGEHGIACIFRIGG